MAQTLGIEDMDRIQLKHEMHGGRDTITLIVRPFQIFQ